jgi:hypothetical protein
MQYRLTQNLGLDDARHCNAALRASLDLSDPKSFAAGSIIELPKEAAEWLTGPKGRGMGALLEPANVRGQAKQPEVTAPAK